MKSIAGTLAAPFPYFGGKANACELVWSLLGLLDNYVEPFAGSAAMILGRPDGDGVETINDFDGFVANFWRAISKDPNAVAFHADWPVNECDLLARHSWLVRQKDALRDALHDPEYFDAKIAGWWCWGVCNWIGSGWCSGNGPWVWDGEKIVDRRQLPHLGNAGRGINRQLPHLGNAGMGDRYEAILHTFQELSDRLRNVRVCCGDWTRIIGESVTVKHAGITGVFLDPPYADTANRTDNLYACDDTGVAHDVREWCLANGNNPRLRIALCGYEGEHVMPASWACVPWKASGGYGSQGETTGRDNATKERIWLSPACLPLLDAVQPGLFEDAV